MPFSSTPIGHTKWLQNTDGGTSPGIDTTGADLLLVASGGYGSAPGLISDSFGNAWNSLTAYLEATGSEVQLWYAKNPAVGAGHTITMNVSGATYGEFHFLAFSGADLTTPFDQQSEGTTQPGTITPGGDDHLLIAANCMQTSGGSSIDSGFTLAGDNAYGSGVNMGGMVAYLVQGAAAAVNPTVTPSTSAVAMASFKPAPGGSVALAGSFDGVCDVNGALEVTRSLAGSAAGVSAVNASLDVVRQLAFAAAGVSDLSAGLEVTRSLSVSAAGVSTVHAALDGTAVDVLAETFAPAQIFETFPPAQIFETFAPAQIFETFPL